MVDGDPKHEAHDSSDLAKKCEEGVGWLLHDELALLRKPDVDMRVVVPVQRLLKHPWLHNHLKAGQRNLLKTVNIVEFIFRLKDLSCDGRSGGVGADAGHCGAAVDVWDEAAHLLFHPLNGGVAAGLVVVTGVAGSAGRVSTLHHRHR